MPNIKTDTLILKIEGAGGGGGSSVGEILARAAARSGFYIQCSRAFPAEIKGGRAWFQLKVSSRPVGWWGGSPDLLMTDARGGDWRLAINNADGEAERLPFSPLESARELGNPRNANIAALGFWGGLLGLDLETLTATAQERYARRGTVLDELSPVIAAGHRAARQSSLPCWTAPQSSGGRRLVLNGNEAIAVGALAAGVRFFTGYPITPASSILELMLSELPSLGGTALQMEDEIAALAACLGASYAGAKAMCATSGPGFALMSELLNLAVMAEIPITIVDVQRSGPATGQPSKSEQADLLYAIHGSPGDVQRIVLAPATVEEALTMTAKAVALSERFQMPVIILSDAALSNRIEAVPEPLLEALSASGERRRPETADGGAFQRYLATQEGISPMPLPGADDTPYIASGMEHDAIGRPTGSAELHYQMAAKRAAKLTAAAGKLKELFPHKFNGNSSPVGVLGWGSTRGAIEAAAARLMNINISVATAHLRVLHPLPENELKTWLDDLEVVFVAEENRTGQLAQLVRYLAPDKIRCLRPVSEASLTPEYIAAEISELWDAAGNNGHGLKGVAVEASGV